MPYCSKCGIEVDHGIKRCPLCHFSIPEIETDEEVDTNRFPTAENGYPREQRELKKVIYMIVSTMMLATCILMFFLNTIFSGRLTWAKYSIVSVIAAWGYLGIGFGFIRNFIIAILLTSINTSILLFFIDSFNGRLEWFFPVGVPLVLLALAISLIIETIYIKSKKKIFNNISYIIVGIAFFAIGIEALIDLYLRQTIELVWSIIVAIQLISIALLLLYISHRLPQRYKEELKKRFHM